METDIMCMDCNKTIDKCECEIYPIKSQALRLCQKIGMTTMFTEFNEGMSLPLDVSKKIAITIIIEICPATDYWNEVKEEINNL